MAYPYSALATPINDSTTATPNTHAGHHNSVHGALNDLLTELATAPRSLVSLNSGLLAVKVWSTGSSAYVWPTGTAPDSNSYTNIVFVDPGGTHNPASSTGGRSVANDLWETGTTPAGLPAGGTTNQVLTKTSSTDYATTWSTPSAGGGTSLLASKTHFPGTLQGISTTSTTFADVDATNLVVTFTVPASGQVIARLEAGAACAPSTVLAWNLRQSSSDVTNSQAAVIFNLSGNMRMTKSVLITGLTPSTSTTWKWGHARTSGSGTVSTLWGGTDWGQALMEIWSA